jgi:hypothetical protein
VSTTGTRRDGRARTTVAELADLPAKDVPVQEQQRGECLILGRRADLAGHGEVGQEGVDLGFGHVAGVAEIVEVDEATDPQTVCLLGPPTVVTRAQGGA